MESGFTIARLSLRWWYSESARKRTDGKFLPAISAAHYFLNVAPKEFHLVQMTLRADLHTVVNLRKKTCFSKTEENQMV